YYYFPGEFVRDTPGMFTGSGLPQRFARADGTAIDCYQAPTVFTDDAHESIPRNVEVVLDHALGREGWYGAFVCNAHITTDSDHVSDDIVHAALARGVPVVSAAPMLTWVNAPNPSSFPDLPR